MLRTAATTPTCRPCAAGCARLSVRTRIPLKALLDAHGCGKEEVASACPKVTRKPSRRSMLDNLASLSIGISAMLLAGRARADEASAGEGSCPTGCRDRKPLDAEDGLEACETLPDKCVKCRNCGGPR